MYTGEFAPDLRRDHHERLRRTHHTRHGRRRRGATIHDHDQDGRS